MRKKEAEWHFQRYSSRFPLSTRSLDAGRSISETGPCVCPGSSLSTTEDPMALPGPPHTRPNPGGGSRTFLKKMRLGRFGIFFEQEKIKCNYIHMENPINMRCQISVAKCSDQCHS